MPAHLRVAGRSFRVPRQRWMRVVLGVLFLLGGVLGILPILGFWMIPLGLVLLSWDVPVLRRWRRVATVWIGRRSQRVAAWRERRVARKQ